MTATASRRSLLTAFACFLAGALLPGGRLARMVQSNPLDSLLEKLRRAESARAITAAWSTHHLAPDDPAELRASLLRRIGPNGELLQSAIADDFLHGRMLVVDGWPVADSEARLCVLAQLTQS